MNNPALQAERHGMTGSPDQKHYNSGSTSQTNKKSTAYLTTGQTNGTDSVATGRLFYGRVRVVRNMKTLKDAKTKINHNKRGRSKQSMQNTHG